MSNPSRRRWTWIVWFLYWRYRQGYEINVSQAITLMTDDDIKPAGFSCHTPKVISKDQTDSGPCEEVTVSVGFDLFRLKKLNNRNFNDIVLNMISEQQTCKWRMISHWNKSKQLVHWLCATDSFCVWSRSFITHADCSRVSIAIMCLCLSVRTIQTKTDETKIAKLGTEIVHHDTSPTNECWVRGQG